MEDAHIASVPFGDKKCGLFGVFDGHGGIKHFTKGPSARFSWKSISPKNLGITKVSRKENTKKLSNKRSSRWMSFCSPKQAKQKS